ncbi:MAG: amidase [Candidatus Rokuibacteriota bacterium]
MTLHELTASEAAALIRARQLSPVDLVEALLARIAAVDGRVKAWTLVDHEGARAVAQRCAAEAASGAWRGPLHGVPFGIKDIFYTAGLRTEAGSRVLAGFVPTWDATSVARLTAAGAIVLGKCHTTEFATLDPAPTRNPWNLDHTPGGSSSGPAGAVAARTVPLAFGSQTIGSNNRPASYCGLVGFKPTHGRIPARGVLPLAWTQDHVGLMARSVEDVALMLQATAGHDPADPTSSAQPVPDFRVAIERRRPPRIGVPRPFFFERGDAEVRRAAEEAMERLRRAGATLDDTGAPASLEAALGAAWTIVQVEAAAYHRELHATKAELYGPRIREMIEVGMLVPGELYVRALRLRRRFRRELAEIAAPFDVLLTPSTTTPAPPGMPTGDPAFQTPWSFSGWPSLTLPCALSAAGLPLGIQLIARPFDEAPLLSAAAWCEEVLGRASAPPL